MSSRQVEEFLAAAWPTCAPELRAKKAKCIAFLCSENGDEKEPRAMRALYAALSSLAGDVDAKV